jgi:hypothetical protein
VRGPLRGLAVLGFLHRCFVHPAGVPDATPRACPINSPA